VAAYTTSHSILLKKPLLQPIEPGNYFIQEIIAKLAVNRLSVKIRHLSQKIYHMASAIGTGQNG